MEKCSLEELDSIWKEAKIKRMKTTKYVFSLLIFLSITICQVDNLDWPNLNKYKNDNKRIRNTAKKVAELSLLEILLQKVGIGITQSIFKKKRLYQ